MEEWDKSKRRKPLILMGARQVGKTWLMDEFAHRYYPNDTVRLAECPYFTTNLIALDKPMRKNFVQLDSFVIYLCTDGIAAVKTLDTICPIHAGECVLVPAAADTVELYSEGAAKLLEVYVDPKQWNEEGVNHTLDFDWMAQFIGNGNPDDYLDDKGLEELDNEV